MKNYIIKNFLLLSIFLSAFLSFTSTKNYAVSFYAPSIDASLMDSYLAEDESDNEAVQVAVSNFYRAYITQNMNDFQKEMQIIKFLVANVDFDVEEVEANSYRITDSYKAYGALINGKAVCSGYAKAFDLLAKACGLNTNIVTGTAINSDMFTGPHAWNQICLDGEWYNVDVTWEDPTTNVELGFIYLFNKYINRTDAEFSYDHIRENGYECFATKYGESTVAYYIHTDSINTTDTLDDLRRTYINHIAIANAEKNETLLQFLLKKFFLLGIKYDDNSNFLEGTDEAVNRYVLDHIFNNENVITFVTGPNTKKKLNIDQVENWLRNNMAIPGKYELRNFFLSNGRVDSRIIIFNSSTE